ncbi:MAG TPA: lipopolysaccharide biosynthesis protein [Methylococcaceae bacterium]|nr:lipopolysaccharide biosynthesis protein [Methylococcaceae bacterium]
MDKNVNQIRTNSLWVLSGKTVGQGSQFVFGIVLARLLVPEDFGLVVAVQVFTGLAGFIAGGGMGGALIQAKVVTTRHFHVVFTLQMAICTLIYLFFYLSAPLFADYFNNPIYSDLMKVSALSFLTRPFMNVSGAKLKREMRFKVITITGMISGLLSGSISVLLAYHGYGPWSIIWGGLSGLTASIPILLITSKLFPRIQFDKKIAKQLGSRGLRFTSNEILEHLRRQTPNFLLSKTLGTQAVGLFNKGESLSQYPIQFVAGSAYQTVFRTLSSHQDNLDKSKYIYLRTITLVCVYTLPFYIGLMWLAEPFITTLYGEKWRLATVPLQIFCMIQMLACFGNPSGAVMAAQNMLGTEVKLQLVSLVMTGVGCWYGIQQNDIAWVALYITPALFFLYFSVAFFACKRLHVSFIEFYRSIFPGLILSTCLTLVLLLFEALKYFFYLDQDQLTYMLSISVLGGLTYGLLFLFLPISSLKTEQNRWKQKIFIFR